MRTTISLAGLILAISICASLSMAGEKNKEGKKPLAGYSSIFVAKFEVEKNPATEDFPKGLETMMQARMVKDLRKRKVFGEVVDGSETPLDSNAVDEKPPLRADTPKVGQEKSSTQIILSATVFTFDKGNRAARYMVGFGAGESRVKMRIVLRDAATGAEVVRFDQQGTFMGTLSVFGGGGDEASIKAAGAVVNKLIKELENIR